MGFHKWSTSKTAPIAAPNPDPLRFKVEREQLINGHSILLVKYEGCTTFGGKKLLLLKRRWDWLASLDPHLLGGDHVVMARFEPTELGWMMARLCATLSIF